MANEDKKDFNAKMNNSKDMPKNKPSSVEIPRMNYIAVRGTGNPNEENGDYQNTIGLLYGVESKH